MRLSEEHVVKNAKTIESLISKFSEDRCAAVKKMFEKIGDEFYSAPASSREDYHGCFPGGLADHSLRVASTLTKMADVLAPDKYTREQLVFLGLVHDLGKIGDGELPFYVPLEGDQNAWKRKRGELYGINPDLPYMPTCDRTIYVLNRFGISLTAEEYIAVRISDGPYEKSNEKYNMKEPDLAVLLHFADRWATQIEKQS